VAIRASAAENAEGFQVKVAEIGASVAGLRCTTGDVNYGFRPVNSSAIIAERFSLQPDPRP
jgi:galactose mutarotase-like enzyme